MVVPLGATCWLRFPIARKCGRSVPRERRKRRALTKTYQAEVVELVRKGGKSIGAIAKDLDLTETAVRA
jgi:transposase-like protein